MKKYRFDLHGTGPTVDFIIRIPNGTVYDGQMFVEMLTIDSGSDNTNDLNSIHVKSNKLSDVNGYSTQTNSFNLIAQLANNLSYNSNKDFRFSQLISNCSVGFPVKIADLSNYSFNVTLQQDNHTDIDAAWTWSIRLLIIDGEEPNNLIQFNKDQGGYFGKVPERVLMPKA